MRRWLALLCGFASGASLAVDTLHVVPSRVVLSDKKPIAHLSLKHEGPKPGTYGISAVFYRMTPQGNLERVDQPEAQERSAVPYLRFSPGKITLAPNKEKAIRVLFKGPKNLPDGEYRAHLHLTSLDDKAPAVSPPPGKAGEISQQMSTSRSVAVPVFYRKGNPEFKATLTNLGLFRLPDQTPAFRAELKTEGNGFPYGDLFVFYAEKGSTSPKTIGITRNVASYTEKRELQYPLSLAPTVSLNDGVIRVELRQPEDEGGALITFLEAPVQ